MCLIISRTKGAEIPASFLANGLANNPHGWGLMWASNGRIKTAKGMAPGRFNAALKQAGKRDVHVHFRYATHGVKNELNCHPFPILAGEYALMHNGIISIDCRDKTRSDTWHFANDVLAPMLAASPRSFGEVSFAETLGEIVGEGNKLVILRRDGECMYVNRNEGVERDSLWLSNAYSVEPARPLWAIERKSNYFGRSAWSGRDDITDRWNEIDSGYRQECPADLIELADMSVDEITDICRDDPEGTADAIHYLLKSLQEYLGEDA